MGEWSTLTGVGGPLSPVGLGTDDTVSLWVAAVACGTHQSPHQPTALCCGSIHDCRYSGRISSSNSLSFFSVFFVNYCLEFTVYSKCTSGSGARCMVGRCAELQPQVPTALRLGRLPSMAAGGVRDILCHTDDMGSCGSQIRTHERDTLDPV